MRKVIFIPMIHEEGDTPAIVRDVTNLSSDLQDVLSEVRDTWPKLIQGRERLVDDPDKTRVFCEAMMDVSWFTDAGTRFAGKQYSDDQAKEIMERLSAKNRGHDAFDTDARRLLLYLLVRGAHIEVTEDEQIYGQRHEAIDENMKAIRRFYDEGADNFTRFTEEELERIDRSFDLVDEAMRKTDEFVVGQINTNLRDGETGILVFGAAHFRILDMLDPDIQVDYLSEEVREMVLEERGEVPISHGEAMRREFLEWQEGWNAERSQARRL